MRPFGTRVFKGTTHRVQVKVFDFTTPDTPASLKKSRPDFSVSILPNECHKATAFSRGRVLFHGDDPDRAFDIVAKYVPNLSRVMPPRMMRYFLKWKIEA